jgi:hypothetical protein
MNTWYLVTKFDPISERLGFTMYLVFKYYDNDYNITPEPGATLVPHNKCLGQAQGQVSLTPLVWPYPLVSTYEPYSTKQDKENPPARVQEYDWATKMKCEPGATPFHNNKCLGQAQGQASPTPLVRPIPLVSTQYLWAPSS